MTTKTTTLSFLQKIKQKRKDKGKYYDYSSVNYENSYTKIKIICPIHGEFLQQPNNHLNGQNCPTCSIESVASKKRCSLEKFIEKANKCHNNKYDYSKFEYKNNKTKGIIVCSIHGEFQQSPYCHVIRNHECPICGNDKIREKLSSNKKTFVDRSNELHKNFYDYSKFIYKNANTKSIIICPIHGEFNQNPRSHLNFGNGCPMCGIEKQKQSLIYSNEEFIQKSKKIHGDKYDYSLIDYKYSHNHIMIICKKHGKFFQTPNSHLNGSGCPKCVHQVSKPEIKFLDYCNVEQRHISIKPYIVDGYNPKTKTIYEFLGDYYHGNPNKYNFNSINKKCKIKFGQLYTNTFKKFNVLKNIGYTIKYIWESDWDRYISGVDKIPNIITY